MALRILSLELPVDILLELLHVEELDSLVLLQQASRQLQDVVATNRGEEKGLVNYFSHLAVVKYLETIL